MSHRLQTLALLLLLMLLAAAESQAIAGERNKNNSQESDKNTKPFVGDFPPPDYLPKPQPELAETLLAPEEQELQRKWKQTIVEAFQEQVFEYSQVFLSKSGAYSQVSFRVNRDGTISNLRTSGSSRLLNAMTYACLKHFKRTDLLHFPDGFTVNAVDLSFMVPGVRNQVQIGDFNATKVNK